MASIKYLTIAFCCIIVLTTCKKYPEGGYINKGDNYIEGTWTLALYEVNGIDSTESINYNGNDNFKTVYVTKFQSDKTNLDIKGSGGTNIQYGVLKNNNKNLEIYPKENKSKICSSGLCLRIYLAPEGYSTDWTIQKLTKSEFTITSSLINSYKLKFNR